MKIKLKTEEMKEIMATTRIIMARSKNATNTIYNNIQFMFKNGELYLYVFDGIHVMQVKYSESVENSDLSVMVEYVTLSKLISLAESEFIDLDFQESKLNFIEDTNSYDLSYCTDSDFSYLLPNMSESTPCILSIESGDLKSVSKFIQPTLPQSQKSAQYPGVYYDGNFVATKSSACSVLKFADKKKNGVYLSPASFQILQSLSSLPTKFDIYDTGGVLLVLFPNSIVTLSKMASDFPNYEPIIQRKKGHEFTYRINKDTFIKACKKLSAITDVTLKNSCKIMFFDDEIKLIAQSETKRGEERLKFDIIKPSGEAEFSINLYNLLAYLYTIEDDAVALSFSKEMREYSIEYGSGNISGFYIETTLQ